MTRIEKNTVIQLDIDFNHVMIYLILFFSSLNTLSVILVMQTGTPAIVRQSSQTIRILLLASTVVYIIGNYIAERKIRVRSWVVNTYLYLIYLCIPTILFFHLPIINILIGGFAWPLTFVAYFIFSEKNEFTWLFRKSVLFFSICCAIAMIKTITTRGYQGTNTGSIYYLLSFLPMLLLFCTSREKIVLSVIMTFFAFLSLKRGAILEVITGVIGFSSYKVYRDGNIRQKGGSLILAIIVILGVFVGIQYMSIGGQVVDRFLSISEDGGSGRNEIWEYIMQLFHESPVIKKIIGHGYLAFPYEHGFFGTKAHAHNGYLEALYDLGLIGSIWLGFIVLSLCFFLFRRIKTKNILVGPGIAAICAVLVLSMISYFFEECGHILMIASFFGIFLGRREQFNLPVGTPMEQAKCRYIK